MQSKSFKDWNFEEVEDTFELQKVENLPTLEKWLSCVYHGDDAEREIIDTLQKKLRREVSILNEEELKMRFIGKLIDLVDFFNGEYRYFLDRKLTIEKDGIKVEGKVDFMVARGKQTPKQPFFFLYEYKKEKGYASDPLGQLLMAMLAAQARNESGNQPIYGIYVIGRFWFFVVLEEKKYAVSLAYDSTREAIFEVVGFLKGVKGYIEAFISKK